MKRVWLTIAVIGLMVVLSSVGCSSGASNAPAQNAQPGSLQQPAQNPSGGQPGQGGQPESGGNPPGAFGGSGMSGTVKSVSGSTIQLSAQDGSTVTVKTDDKTTYQKTVAGTLADVQSGVRLIVTGDQSSGTITAKTIQIGASGDAGMPPSGGSQGMPNAGQPGQGGGPQGTPAAGQPGQGGGQPGGTGMPTMGTVKSVSGSTIQLTGQDGSTTITVQVNDKTTYRKITTAALSDVTAGVQIMVVGDSSSGTVTAQSIQIGTNSK